MCGPQGPLSSAKRRALLDHLPRYRPRSGALQGHQVGIQWSGRKNAESNEESFSLLEYVVGFILLNIQEQNRRVDLSFIPPGIPFRITRPTRGPISGGR